jgi:two-component system chemotaxis sensor kinase CheA
MYDMFQRVTMLRFIDPSAFLEKNKLLVQSLLRASQKKGIIEATARVYMIERRYFEIFDDVCLHVLRNAVDHGIESPHERRINGKNEVARITVDLCETDCNIELRIGDDGRGVDLGKVRHKAIARGLTTPEAAAALDDRSLLQMLFSPGFSTTDVPSDISGRGVGLDVVKQRVESAHGIIDVETSPGKGTLFVVRLPKSERHYG